MKKGVPVSPGVAVARAHCVQQMQVPGPNAAPLDAAALSGEIRRFERACNAAARDLDETIARVARQVISPIAGQLITHLVKVGDAVAADTEVGIVEAMKMHIPVAAEQTGRVAKWLVSEMSVVAEGEPLLELEPER